MEFKFLLHRFVYKYIICKSFSRVFYSAASLRTMQLCANIIDLITFKLLASSQSISSFRFGSSSVSSGLVYGVDGILQSMLVGTTLLKYYIQSTRLFL